MKLKNILIVVKDIEKSKQFYHDLFGLDTVLDNGGNIILTEGLVLQDEKIWKGSILPSDMSIVLRRTVGGRRWSVFMTLTAI